MTETHRLQVQIRRRQKRGKKKLLPGISRAALTGHGKTPWRTLLAAGQFMLLCEGEPPFLSDSGHSSSSPPTLPWDVIHDDSAIHGG